MRDLVYFKLLLSLVVRWMEMSGWLERTACSVFTFRTSHPRQPQIKTLRTPYSRTYPYLSHIRT